MLGAIVGDVIGSPFEYDRNREKAHSREYPLVSPWSKVTDATIMTLAVADALMQTMPVRGEATSERRFRENVVRSLQSFCVRYKYADYGARFYQWIFATHPEPYESYGSGSAVRVSPVAWAFDSLDEVETFAKISASITHNHPEGIKGAQAVAGAIFLARIGQSKDDIREYIMTRYHGYDLIRRLEDIRPTYHHEKICQKTVPEAIIAFLSSEDFEDAARNAVSLSGDADTLAAITCSIAEAAYGIPDEISETVMPKLDGFQQSVLSKWEKWRAQ